MYIIENRNGILSNRISQFCSTFAQCVGVCIVYQSLKWFAFNMFCLYFQLSRYFFLSGEMWITLMHLLGLSQTWNNIIFNGGRKIPCSLSLLFLTSSRQFSQNSFSVWGNAEMLCNIFLENMLFFKFKNTRSRALPKVQHFRTSLIVAKEWEFGVKVCKDWSTFLPPWPK